MLYDTANFTFYIKKQSGLIPFNSYSVKDKNGDGIFYHYLSRDEEKEKLSNRWAVLHHCGKKFIANEGTQYETEANPNEVIVFAHGVAKKRMLISLLSLYLLTIIFWAIDYFRGEPFRPQHYFKMGLIYTVFIAFVFVIMFLKSWEWRNEAKAWNAKKIPDDKLFRHQFRISEILSLTNRLREINFLNFDDIDFLDEKGNKIIVDPKIIEDWKLLGGINNCDFITSGFYKKRIGK